MTWNPASTLALKNKLAELLDAKGKYTASAAERSNLLGYTEFLPEKLKRLVKSIGRVSKLVELSKILEAGSVKGLPLPVTEEQLRSVGDKFGPQM